MLCPGRFILVESVHGSIYLPDISGDSEESPILDFGEAFIFHEELDNNTSMDTQLVLFMYNLIKGKSIDLE